MFTSLYYIFLDFNFFSSCRSSCSSVLEIFKLILKLDLLSDLKLFSELLFISEY